jgi:ankyrin repeat protein
MGNDFLEGAVQAPDVVYWSSLGHAEKVDVALKQGGDPNAVDEGGYSALQAASENNHLDIVKLLVSKGANVNYESNGFTALKLANAGGHNLVVEFLTENGAK